MNITITDKGNLRLELEPSDDVEYARERLKKVAMLQVLWDLMEGYWNNGSYYPFSAEDANPFVGLSSAPCIAEDMDIDDDGKLTINGRFWAFENYMLENPVETLLEHGYVEFELVE